MKDEQDPELMESLLQAISHSAGELRGGEVKEEEILRFLERSRGNRTGAAEVWEHLSTSLRNPIVRWGRVFEWNLFRKIVRVTKLPSAEEIERMGELYRLSTPEEVERRIRQLSGLQFERFAVELLRKIPTFRDIVITGASHDGGVDFKGRYVPDPQGPEVALIGQAKQVGGPIGAGAARDFVGALATSRETKPMGLFVSTGGFTEAAVATLRRSPYHVMIWSMKDILQRVLDLSLGTRRISVMLEVVDEIFWDEVFGESKTS